MTAPVPTARLVTTIRALLGVLREHGIQCRAEKDGGCEVVRGPLCEMCGAWADIAEVEGRTKPSAAPEPCADGEVAW